MVNVLILKVSKLAMYTLIMQSSPRSFRTKRGLGRTPSQYIVEEARRGEENRLTPPPGEKGEGGVRETGEEGAGSGITKVAGSGSSIVQYFAIEKNAKRWEPTNTGREPGLKGTGSGRFKPPLSPSPAYCLQLLRKQSEFCCLLLLLRLSV